ncbi:hypothetical protein LX32DRAFT_499155, partial [Colletotrichum zoysiae]
MAESVSAKDFTIGWVCAHPLELEIAVKMMDQQLGGLPSHPSDFNRYAFGRIEGHYVVAAFSPVAERGTSPAAVAARYMGLSFPSIRLAISIGIHCGVPRPVNGIDIRLDDVVIGYSPDRHDEMVQFGLGKVDDSRVTRMESKIASLSTTVMAALEKLRADHILGKTRVSEHLSKLSFLNNLDTPGEARAAASQALSHVSIASPSEVIRDASMRASDVHVSGHVSLFGTEAADLSNDDSQFDFPLVTIRGICDHADKHWSEE